MKTENTKSFFEPIISTFGFIISLITAISPLFGSRIKDAIFFNSNIGTIASFLAFIFGIIIFWIISQFYRYAEIRIGQKVVNGQAVPKYCFSKSKIIFCLFLISLLLSLGYISVLIYGNKENLTFSFVQLIIYILFFIDTISIFAYLITDTLDKYNYEYEKENYNLILANSLEKTGHISQNIKISNISSLIPTIEICRKLNIAPGFYTIYDIKTVNQECKKLKVYTINRGKEIIKVQEIE